MRHLPTDPRPLPEAVPQETASQDIRNALQVLMNLSERMDQGVYLQLEEDLVAMKQRMWSAVNKLEGRQ